MRNAFDAIKLATGGGVADAVLIELLVNAGGDPEVAIDRFFAGQSSSTSDAAAAVGGGGGATGTTQSSPAGSGASAPPGADGARGGAAAGVTINPEAASAAEAAAAEAASMTSALASAAFDAAAAAAAAASADGKKPGALEALLVGADMTHEPYEAILVGGALGMVVENMLENTVVVLVRPDSAAQRAKVGR